MNLQQLTTVFIILPSAMLAQSFPALFEVSGIAKNDVLNIRYYSAPNAHILGNYPANRTGIEVIALDTSGDWGQVNLNEGTGWISMRSLTRLEQADWDSGEVPIKCFGTEPFWTVNLNPEEKVAQYELLGQELEIAEISQFLIPAPNYQPELQLRFNKSTLIKAALSGKFCSDGMSDRLYGIRIDLTEANEDPEQLPSQIQGCCSLVQ